MSIALKFNPNHGPDGRFSSSGEGARASSDLSEGVEAQSTDHDSSAFQNGLSRTPSNISNEEWNAGIAWTYDTDYKVQQDVRDYQGAFHKSLNASLRKGQPLSGKAADIDKSLSKLHDDGAFSTESTTYRGVNVGAKEAARIKQAALDAVEHGGTVTIPEYASTSLKPSVAAQFAGGAGSGVVLEIKGKGLLIPSTYEAEILLNKGSTFKVTRVAEVDYPTTWGTSNTYTTIALEQL